MESIYKFFQDNLHNITASILIGNTSIEGSMEGDCLLKIENKFSGIFLYSLLKWNEGFKVSELIADALNKQTNFSYDQRDKVMQTMVPLLEQQYVRVGTIRPYAIKSINSFYREKELYLVHITYENGTLCEIRNIKPVKV